MERNQAIKQVYLAPRCEMLNVEHESFICVSVRPNPATPSQQGNWDDKGEKDMGNIYFGDPSNSFPAKEGFWEEEEFLDE
ncbi:hypothetical protein [Prevotella sp. oral taxon 475]|uniref:hypothetical protein n=1 Tax=Prevotella sp. oral taxon 475 TaxID=712471 RepID=UPI00201265F7|nr:hypothetical protein [Prevotella sp. oral taxon 475]